MKFFMGASRVGQVFCAPGKADYTVDEHGIMEVKKKSHTDHFIAAKFPVFDPNNPEQRIGDWGEEVVEEEEEDNGIPPLDAAEAEAKEDADKAAADKATADKEAEDKATADKEAEVKAAADKEAADKAGEGKTDSKDTRWQRKGG